MITLATVLGALPKLAPIAAAAPEVKALFDSIVETFEAPADQATLKNAYDLHRAKSEHLHGEVQSELGQASPR